VILLGDVPQWKIKLLSLDVLEENQMKITLQYLMDMVVLLLLKIVVNNYMKYCVPYYKKKALNQDEIISQMPLIFKESFLRCNQGLKSLGVCQETGTTAVVAFSKGNLLWIANVGDSRAVLSKNGVAVRVTTDHKPTLESERNRILDLKGYVIFGRVNGVLAVSRALGDFYFHPHVSCEPEVFGPFDVYNDEYQFLILACDGLWDVVDDNTAVDIVKGSKTPEEGAKRLVKSALTAQSTDNISVVVIFFPNFRLNE